MLRIRIRSDECILVEQAPCSRTLLSKGGEKWFMKLPWLYFNFNFYKNKWLMGVLLKQTRFEKIPFCHTGCLFANTTPYVTCFGDKENSFLMEDNTIKDKITRFWNSEFTVPLFYTLAHNIHFRD